MFNKSKEKKENENLQKTQETSNVLTPKEGSSDFNTNEETANPNRIVKVVSTGLLDSKIVVVYKKIKGQDNKVREVFNIYTFSHNMGEGRGECLMPERDAILFWKDRMETVKVNDTRVITQDGEFEYDYKESKNLYNVEMDSLANSEQR